MPRIFVPWRDHPLRVVVAVVVAVLAVQAVAAVIIAWTSGASASDVATDTAILAGEATAVQVRLGRDSAADSLAEVARLAEVEGLSPAQPDALVPDMVRTLRASASVSALGLADADGASVVVRRTPTGIDAIVRHPDGETEIRRFSREGVDLEVTLPLAQAGADPVPRWIVDGSASTAVTWHEPYVSLSNANIAVYGTVGGQASFGDYVAVAFTETPDLDRSLWSSPGASLGEAWIVTAEGYVVAAPAKDAVRLRELVRDKRRIPQAQELGLVLPTNGAEVGVGRVERRDGTIVYARPVWPEGGLQASADWRIVVEMRTDEVASGAPVIRQTLLAYAVVIVVVVAVSFAALWRLRGPLNEVLRRADSDALTGLANRYEFESRGRAIMEAARAAEARVLVVVLDIDHFKSVNDTWGHEVGDDLLARFGRSLAAMADPRDVVARLGGDEFAVLHWLSDDEDAAAVAERIRAGAATSLAERSNGETAVDASAGFAVAEEGGYELRRVVGAADAALVTGRRQGKAATYGA